MHVIVFTIILLGIGNTMMMSVIERTGEIGTAMALGVKRRKVLGQFVLEGGTIGFVGGLVGLVLAFAITGAMAVLQIEMPPRQASRAAYIATVLLTPPLIVFSPFVAIAVTTLAQPVSSVEGLADGHRRCDTTQPLGCASQPHFPARAAQRSAAQGAHRAHRRVRRVRGG
jgi:putative ABC transport system permease protein